MGIVHLKSVSNQTETDQFTVAVYFLRLLIDYTAGLNLPIETLLSQSDFRPEELADPNGRILFSRFQRLCDTAAQVLNDPWLGLKLGQSVRQGTSVRMALHS